MPTLFMVLGALGIGGILGYAAASFVKTATRVVAIIVGFIFIVIQVLAYYGIIEVHWDAMQSLMPSASTAAKSGFSALWKILVFNLPFTGGFGAGFWYGWKH
jgi:uncharacterized membrane protein (Fun14 family)